MDAVRRAKPTVVSVQYLRACAAVSVVLYHAGTHIGIGSTWPDSVLAAGVDVFFAISGFIMWVTTYHGGVGPRSFLVRRIKRIVPLYWLVTAVAVIVSLVSPSLGGKTSFGDAATSFLFLPAINPATHQVEPIVSPGWTLNYEMFFYLIFAVCLTLPPARRLVAIVTSLAVLSAIGTFISGPLILQFYSRSIVLEFAFGVAVGALYTRHYTLSRHSSAWLSIAAVIALFALNAETSLSRVWMFGVPSALILTCGVLAESRQRWTPRPVPLLLGDSSYAIYLCHGMVLSGLAVVLTHSGAPNSLLMFLGPVIAVIVGVVVYQRLELPIARLLKRQAPHGAGRTPEAAKSPT